VVRRKETRFIMSARLIRAAVLGSLAILLMSPSGIAAQTSDARDNPAVVQTPATHQHDHGSPTPAAVNPETRESCCAKAAAVTPHDADISAPPAADQQSDTTKTPEKGCCGGMMSNMKKDQPMADQAPGKDGHSCCCSGMKM
jgi:hypothetical protein